MSFDNIGQALREAATGGVLAMMWGVVGRAMYHAREVQHGRRVPFSPSLIWEIPIAIGTGIVGQGVAGYAGLTGWPETACIVTIAYLGPGFFEAVIWRAIEGWIPKKGG